MRLILPWSSSLSREVRRRAKLDRMRMSRRAGTVTRRSCLETGKGLMAADTRVVFVMHGNESQTARQACDIAAPKLEALKALVLAPQFSEKDYPGRLFPPQSRHRANARRAT